MFASRQDKPLSQPSGPSSPDLGELTFRDSSRLDILGVRQQDSRSRTPQEIQSLKEKISLIAKVFSRNYNLEVLPSPEGGWSCGIDPALHEAIGRYINGDPHALDSLPPGAMRPKQIFYDAAELADRPEDELLGVLRHEVGHANNTDYRLFFEGQKMARDEGRLPTTWAGIHNALEDPWVNNIEIAGSDIVRQKMTARYARSIPDFVEYINTQPPTHQLGLNIIHYWVQGESIPTLKDTAVKEAFDKIRPAVEQYFHGRSAADNYRLLNDLIWPHIKTLEDRSLSQEELKEAARQASGSDLGAQDGGSGGARRNQGSAAREGKHGNPHGAGRTESGKCEASGARGMFSRLKRMLGMGGVENDAAPSSAAKQAQAAHAPGEDTDTRAARAALKKAIQQTSLPGFRDEMKKELAAQKRDRNADKDWDESALDADIDLDKLPPELLRQLAQIVDNLDPEMRRELGKCARENLDAKQAANLKRSAPQHIEMQKDQESGEFRAAFRRQPDQDGVDRVREELSKFEEEQEDRAAEQARADAEAEAQRQAEAAARQRQEALKKEMIRNGFEEHERELFRAFQMLEGSMRQRVDNFIKILDRYLPKKETFEYGGEFYSGPRINADSVNKRAPIKDYRVFERREIIDSHEPRMFVQLLIDNSGSMAGEKMQESLKTAVFWGRVLRRFEIPFAIKFFGSTVQDVLSFNQDYDNPRYRVKPALISQGNAMGGATDMGTPLRRASDEMLLAKRKFSGSYGAVFVVSDSGANQGITGGPLKDLIQRMQKDFIVMNFILSVNAGEIAEAKDYFGEKNVIAPANFKDLPDESFKVLRVMLERVLKVYKPA